MAKQMSISPSGHACKAYILGPKPQTKCLTVHPKGKQERYEYQDESLCSSSMIPRLPRKSCHMYLRSYNPLHACESVRDLRIVLIDGQQLAQLMFNNDLGVSKEAVYEIKKVDRDYFS